MEIIYITPKEAIRRLSMYLAKHCGEIVDKYYSDDYWLDFRLDIVENRRPSIDIYGNCEVEYKLPNDRSRYVSNTFLLEVIFLDDVDGIEKQHEIIVSTNPENLQD